MPLRADRRGVGREERGTEMKQVSAGEWIKGQTGSLLHRATGCGTTKSTPNGMHQVMVWETKCGVQIGRPIPGARCPQTPKCSYCEAEWDAQLGARA